MDNERHGENCRMCSGEVCALCGAGAWRNPQQDGVPCEHGTLERHTEPSAAIRGRATNG